MLNVKANNPQLITTSHAILLMPNDNLYHHKDINNYINYFLLIKQFRLRIEGVCLIIEQECILKNAKYYPKVIVQRHK